MRREHDKWRGKLGLLLALVGGCSSQSTLPASIPAASSSPSANPPTTEGNLPIRGIYDRFTERISDTCQPPDMVHIEPRRIIISDIPRTDGKYRGIRIVNMPYHGTALVNFELNPPAFHLDVRNGQIFSVDQIHYSSDKLSYRIVQVWSAKNRSSGQACRSEYLVTNILKISCSHSCELNPGATDGNFCTCK